jgi:DNA topoisomerase III
MRLYICEKPSQAKDLAPHVGATRRGDGKIDGDGVCVTWCIGHLLEQASPEHYDPILKSWRLDALPVLPSQWQMNVKDKTRSQFVIIKSLLKAATEVVIATDADREGEVIAREVMQLCGYKGAVSRLWLSALDSASIKKALSKLKTGRETLPLYLSGLGRARADWLAGMNLTMALTSGFGSGSKTGVMHCGRVQTPVLALIVRRERAITGFRSHAYFEGQVDVVIHNQTVTMQWIAPAEALDKDGHIQNRATVQALVERINGKAGSVAQREVVPVVEKAPLLYSLGALQRDANARFGLKAQAVLDAAQKLYETYKATSYPRTDCEYLPQSMGVEVSRTLEALAKVDPSLQPLLTQCKTIPLGRVFNDAKMTAHHAIIPTTNALVDVKAMTTTERQVYQLIRLRYIAQFLGDSHSEKTTLKVHVGADQLQASGKTVLVQGFRTATEHVSTKNAKPALIAEGGSSNEQPEQLIPACKVGDPATVAQCHVKDCKTQAPRRYTEGTLLAAMESIDKEISDPRLKLIMKNKEKAGIGTDATRSAIIEGLFRREYIENDKKLIFPTVRGFALIELMEKVAPAMTDPVLTAQWEEQLNQVEQGTLHLEQFEGDLGRWLGQLVEQIRESAKNTPNTPLPNQNYAPTIPSKAGQRAAAPAKRNQTTATAPAANQPVQVPCPRCASALRRISGSNGFFWGCSAFKSGCKGTLADNNGVALLPKLVPEKQVFTAVESSSTASEKALTSKAAVAAQLGATCPTCSKGKLIGRQTAVGKSFMGCTTFPTCRHFEW